MVSAALPHHKARCDITWYLLFFAQIFGGRNKMSMADSAATLLKGSKKRNFSQQPQYYETVLDQKEGPDIGEGDSFARQSRLYI